MFRVWATADFFHFTADALRGRVARIRIARSPINLVELSEIGLSSKRILDYVQVGAELICGDLYAALYALRNVLYKVFRRG